MIIGEPSTLHSKALNLIHSCYGTIMRRLNYVVVVGKMFIILWSCRADMCGERRAKAYSGLVPQC